MRQLNSALICIFFLIFASASFANAAQNNSIYYYFTSTNSDSNWSNSFKQNDLNSFTSALKNAGQTVLSTQNDPNLLNNFAKSINQKTKTVILYFTSSILSDGKTVKVCSGTSCYSLDDLSKIIKTIPASTQIKIIGNHGHAGIIHDLSYQFKNVCTLARSGRTTTVQEPPGRTYSAMTYGITEQIKSAPRTNSLTTLAIGSSHHDPNSALSSTLSSQEYLDLILTKYNSLPRNTPRSKITTLKAIEKVIGYNPRLGLDLECATCGSNSLKSLEEWATQIGNNISVEGARKLTESDKKILLKNLDQLNDAADKLNTEWSVTKQSSSNWQSDKELIKKFDARFTQLREEIYKNIQPLILDQRVKSDAEKIDIFNRLATQDEKATLNRLIKCENEIF